MWVRVLKPYKWEPACKCGAKTFPPGHRSVKREAGIEMIAAGAAIEIRAPTREELQRVLSK